MEENSSQLTLNRKTILALAGIAVLLGATVLTVYLVQQKQIFKPRAYEAKPASVPETSFTLAGPHSVIVGQQVRISLLVKSDIDAANLFAAKLKFPADMLEATSVNVTGGTLNPTSGKVCAQIITRACLSSNPQVCDNFPTPCDVPSGWVVSGSSNSSNSGGSPVAIPSSGPYCKLVEKGPRYSGKVVSGTTTAVSPGERLNLVASIIRDDGNHRNIRWETSGGNIQNSAWDLTDWVAPTPPGTYTVSLSINNLPQPNCISSFTVNNSSTGFIKNWVENYVDNKTGTISLVGGIPTPGYKTQVGENGVEMAEITFTAKKVGPVTIAFDPDSAIYRNLDNTNILTTKREVSFSVVPGPTPSCTPKPPCLDAIPRCLMAEPATGWCSITPAPTKTLTPTPTITQGMKGDVNGDNKIDLIDMSVLLSNWGKSGEMVGRADLNGDGLVNVFDYSAMIKLLIDNKVIKGISDLPATLNISNTR
ncbi:MAG: dockerin type I repeat-containing protein [Patescibacteria group bacterium]|nr:dockerin type I repeat-containing protein [Patescibacteria group bacterium]